MVLTGGGITLLVVKAEVTWSTSSSIEEKNTPDPDRWNSKLWLAFETSRDNCLQKRKFFSERESGHWILENIYSEYRLYLWQNWSVCDVSRKKNIWTISCGEQSPNTTVTQQSETQLLQEVFKIGMCTLWSTRGNCLPFCGDCNTWTWARYRITTVK